MQQQSYLAAVTAIRIPGSSPGGSHQFLWHFVAKLVFGVPGFLNVGILVHWYK